MIVKSIDIIKQHIGINKGFDYSQILPYITRAARIVIVPLIGSAQYKIFDEYTGTDEDIVNAIKLAQAAESNFAYYLYLPMAAVQITTGGIFVPETENAKPATDKHFKELQRSFKTAGHEAIDELLMFMESKKAKFEPWTSSDQYKSYKELLVNSTALFNKYFNIFNSYQTFMGLLPTIRNVENQFIKGPVQDVLLTALKADQTEPTRVKVKQLLQQSIVAFTIAKTVNDGIFVINTEGMYLRFDMLPYDKVTSFDKGGGFLEQTAKSKTIEAEEYLKQALKLILANTEIFTEYQVTAPAAAPSRYIETQSIIGL